MSLVYKSTAKPISPAVSCDGNLSDQTDRQLLVPDLDFTFVKGQVADDAMAFGQEKCGLRDAMP